VIADDGILEFGPMVAGSLDLTFSNVVRYWKAGMTVRLLILMNNE
jgi:hypothetical protein